MAEARGGRGAEAALLVEPLHDLAPLHVPRHGRCHTDVNISVGVYTSRHTYSHAKIYHICMITFMDIYIYMCVWVFVRVSRHIYICVCVYVYNIYI